MTSKVRTTVTILLVEDDPGDQELMRRALAESSRGEVLHVVADGERALDYLRRQGDYAEAGAAPRPDLVILDLNLPRLDGADVLRAMRSDPSLRCIPVVVFTTSREGRDVARSYDLGANSYIAKPLTMEQYATVLVRLQDYWFDTVLLPGAE